MIRLAIILIPCALALPFLLLKSGEDRPLAAATREVDAAPSGHSPAIGPGSTFAIEGYGTARARHFPRIKAEVAGEVTALGPDLRPGGQVVRGQTLISIRDAEYRQRLAQAESALRIEEVRLTRLDIEEKHCGEMLDRTCEQVDLMERDKDLLFYLKDRGNASIRECNEKLIELERERTVLQTFQQQMELFESRRQQIVADCGRMRAEVELARLNVDRCVVKAPCDGRIVELKVDVGDRVQPGDLLLSMLDPIVIEVTVELPVSARERVLPDTPCTLFRESAPGTTWSGTIARLSPRANEAKQTFELYVDVDNAAQDTPLIPGYFVRALIHNPNQEQAHAERYVPPSRDGSAGLP